MKPWFPVLALVCLGAIAPGSVQAQALKVSVPVEDLEKAAARDSADPIAFYNLALGSWSKKRWDDVEKALDRALVLEPRLAVAHLAKAHLPFARRMKLWNDLWDEKKHTPEILNTVAQMEESYRRAFFFDPLVDLRIIGAVTPGKSYVWESDPMLSAIWDVWMGGFEDFRDGDYGGAFNRFERMIEIWTDTGRRSDADIPERLRPSSVTSPADALSWPEIRLK